MKNIKLIAAMLLVVMVLFCSACNIKDTDSSLTPAETLDKLCIGKSWLIDLGGPFYVANVQELTEGNPWTEDALVTALPVFASNLYKGGSCYLENILTVDDATDRVNAAATALGLTVDSIETDKYNPDAASIPAYESVSASCADTTIRVSADNSVTILYKTPLTLPEGHELNVYSKQAVEKSLEWLTKEYAPVFGAETLTPFVKTGYGVNAEPNYLMYAYEKTGNIVSDILNYNFANAAFSPASKILGLDSGSDATVIYQETLQLVMSHRLLDSLPEKGDYPIISVDKARELLLSDQYYSFADFIPEEAQIAGVELVYNTDLTESEYLMPFYRFWVVAPVGYTTNAPFDESALIEAGLKGYFSFYIPAIDAQYLDFSE